MIDRWLAAAREGVSGERALETVRTVSGHHRIQASPGYDRAADWLLAELERLTPTLRVEREEVAGDGRTRCLGALMPEGWECRHAHADLVDGASIERLCDYDRLPLSLIQRSAPARGRYPLVALEDGTEDEHYRGLEVRGRVVLTRGALHRVHERAVIERGAAGILFDGRRLLPPVRGPRDDPDAVSYVSFWWNGDEPRGWGFVVSPAAGETLRGRLADGRALALDVAIDSRRFATRIPLVSAVLPGRAAGEVLVVAHLCHPRPCANDNASGVAAALESARALAGLRAGGALPAEGRTIRWLWVPELTGTYAWMSRDPARAAATTAALNLDMVGEDQAACGSTLLLEHPPCFSGSFAEELMLRVRERAQDWVTSYSGPGHFSLTRMSEVPYSGGSDHAVLVDPGLGIPCPMLIQWPDRYYHSSHDTLDKCDPASLSLAARCAAAYAASLSQAGGRLLEDLVAAVGRGARRRLLAALGGGEPRRRAGAERLRGREALASLARLGVPETRRAAEQRALEEYADREGAEREATPPEIQEVDARLRPTRRVAAPLDFQRHLLPGWERLDRAERDGWRRLDLEPDGPLVLELAWQAADGRRNLAEIGRLVWLETGRAVPDTIREFFERAARLGLATLEPER